MIQRKGKKAVKRVMWLRKQTERSVKRSKVRHHPNATEKMQTILEEQEQPQMRLTPGGTVELTRRRECSPSISALVFKLPDKCSERKSVIRRNVVDVGRSVGTTPFPMRLGERGKIQELQATQSQESV